MSKQRNPPSEGMVEAGNPQTKMDGIQDLSGTPLPEPPSSLPSLCEECGANPFKYRCPGCSVRTCSLPCVKSHKQRTKCNGKRDRTQFIPVSQFNDAHLLSDYNLLEETKRVADSARRMRRGLISDTPFWLQAKAKEVRRVAHTRKVNVLLLPFGMTMRKRNRSFVHKWKKSIYWTIEWSFYSTNIILINHGVDEHHNLGPLLESHLENYISWNAATKYKLRPFQKEPLNNLKFFIRETVKGTTSSFRELDINSSLNKQLAGITLLEFPVIHVVFPLHFDKFGVGNRAHPASSNVVSELVNDQSSSLVALTEKDSFRKDILVEQCDSCPVKGVDPNCQSVSSSGTGFNSQDGHEFDTQGMHTGFSLPVATQEKSVDPECVEHGDPEFVRMDISCWEEHDGISIGGRLHADTVNRKDKEASNDIPLDTKDLRVIENVDFALGDVLQGSCFSRVERSDVDVQNLDCGFLREEEFEGFGMLEDMSCFDPEGIYSGDLSRLDDVIGDGDLEDGEIAE